MCINLLKRAIDCTAEASDVQYLSVTDSSVLTGTNHGDGGLYINPLVSIDAGMNKDETIEVRFLNATQCILNGVIILLEETTQTL